MKRRTLEQVPMKENTVLIIDTLKREAFTGERILLGSLDTVSFAYEFQATSSACKLILNYPKGKMRIAKGNPFRGHRKPFKDVLKQYNLTHV